MLTYLPVQRRCARDCSGKLALKDRAHTRPVALAIGQDREGRRHRLPRYFYEVPSHAEAKTIRYARPRRRHQRCTLSVSSRSSPIALRSWSSRARARPPISLRALRVARVAGEVLLARVRQRAVRGSAIAVFHADGEKAGPAEVQPEVAGGLQHLAVGEPGDGLQADVGVGADVEAAAQAALLHRARCNSAALTAAVLIAFELVLTHWFYLYIVWFAAFVFVALFALRSDAPTLFDLRCYVREELVDWLQRTQPQALPRARFEGATLLGLGAGFALSSTIVRVIASPAPVSATRWMPHSAACSSRAISASAFFTRAVSCAGMTLITTTVASRPMMTITTISSTSVKPASFSSTPG